MDQAENLRKIMQQKEEQARKRKQENELKGGAVK